jgi:hypothetical protein
MKKKTKLILAALCLIIATTIYAAGPGTADDPVVTKSYVDKVINDLMKKLNVSDSNSANTYQVVTVKQGEVILGKQGTEIIVRGGEGIVLSSAAGGLQDMTDGVDIEGGNIAPRYHLLIVPKEDGRGIMATKELIVMVRGGYIIQ